MSGMPGWHLWVGENVKAGPLDLGVDPGRFSLELLAWSRRTTYVPIAGGYVLRGSWDGNRHDGVLGLRVLSANYAGVECLGQHFPTFGLATLVAFRIADPMEALLWSMLQAEGAVPADREVASLRRPWCMVGLNGAQLEEATLAAWRESLVYMAHVWLQAGVKRVDAARIRSPEQLQGLSGLYQMANRDRALGGDA